jgi:hypothetical protein
MTTTPDGTRVGSGIPGPREEVPGSRGVEPPSEHVPGRRVITRMRHGGHAIVDAAPGAEEAVDVGAVRLGEVTQDAEVAEAGDVTEALALARGDRFRLLSLPRARRRPRQASAGGHARVAALTVEALNDLGNAMIEQGAPRRTRRSRRSTPTGGSSSTTT